MLNISGGERHSYRGGGWLVVGESSGMVPRLCAEHVQGGWGWGWGRPTWGGRGGWTAGGRLHVTHAGRGGHAYRVRWVGCQTQTHTQTHTRTHARTHARPLTHTDTHRHAHTHTHTHTHTRPPPPVPPQEGPPIPHTPAPPTHPRTHLPAHAARRRC